MTKARIIKKIIRYEIVGFGIVVFMLWADELLDVPHNLFGGIATPINWIESLFESVLILALGVFTILSTVRILSHLKYLEGFSLVCSYCKKIHIDENWIPIEDMIKSQSAIKFSYGLCPECVEKQYENSVAS